MKQDVAQRHCASPGCSNWFWLIPEQSRWRYCARCQEKRHRRFGRTLAVIAIASILALGALLASGSFAG